VYNIESKPLVDKFKQLLIFNPELMKQIKMFASQYNSNFGSKKAEGKKFSDLFSVKIPVYYFYQYEQNYQLIGFLNFKVTDWTEVKDIPQGKDLNFFFNSHSFIDEEMN
jgi:hypothetical protein